MIDDWKNIILLSADALRADHLSCYGYHRNTSPNIDSLSEESLRFTNAYSASSHTREAVPALLTGKYPDVAIDSNYHLNIRTIASILSDEGFATGGFHSNPFISRSYGFGEGFDKFDDDLHMGQHKLIALAQRAIDKLRNRHYARAEKINKRSLSWIDSVPDDRPFFLWNHYMDTHGPYEPPEPYATLYTEREISTHDAQSLYQRAINNPESITETERELLIDLYDAEIRYNDEKIGEFLKALRSRNLLDKSLLIITSDHGDAFGEHGYYEHPRHLHEELTKVPLLIRPPGGATKEVTTPASTIDIAPTIIENIDLNHSFPGDSLFTLDVDERAIFMQVSGEGDNDRMRRYSVRTYNHACFCERNRETGKLEFTECQNHSLREKLRAHIRGRVQQEGEQNTESEELDPDIERRLSALGYKE